jgi:hypothetical protein
MWTGLEWIRGGVDGSSNGEPWGERRDEQFSTAEGKGRSEGRDGVRSFRVSPVKSRVMGCFFFFLLLLFSLLDWTSLRPVLCLLAWGVRVPGEDGRFPDNSRVELAGLRVKERDSMVTSQGAVTQCVLYTKLDVHVTKPGFGIA